MKNPKNTPAKKPTQKSESYVERYYKLEAKHNDLNHSWFHWHAQSLNDPDEDEEGNLGLYLHPVEIFDLNEHDDQEHAGTKISWEIGNTSCVPQETMQVWKGIRLRISLIEAFSPNNAAPDRVILSSRQKNTLDPCFGNVAKYHKEVVRRLQQKIREQHLSRVWEFQDPEGNPAKCLPGGVIEYEVRSNVDNTWFHRDPEQNMLHKIWKSGLAPEAKHPLEDKTPDSPSCIFWTLPGLGYACYSPDTSLVRIFQVAEAKEPPDNPGLVIRGIYASTRMAMKMNPAIEDLAKDRIRQIREFEKNSGN